MLTKTVSWTIKTAKLDTEFDKALQEGSHTPQAVSDLVPVYVGSTEGVAFAQGTMLSKMRNRLDFVQKFLDE